MKATFNETVCNAKSCFLTSNFPDNHSFLRSLTYTDASTTSHTPHMHAQNGRNDSDRILQGYNGQGRLSELQRITHLLTVTWGRVDVRVDVIHTAKCLQQGLLKKIHVESR